MAAIKGLFEVSSRPRNGNAEGPFTARLRRSRLQRVCKPRHDTNLGLKPDGMTLLIAFADTR
jgi:hypothetical protein